MLEYLRGRLVEAGGGFAVIDMNGFGCRVSVPDTEEYRSLPPGETITLRAALIVNDGMPEVFGFLTETERELFMTVKSVGSFGAKISMACVSHMAPSALAGAISSGDRKALRKIPGMGDKKADRLILELRGNALVSMLAEASPGADPAEKPEDGAKDAAADAAKALEGLGCSAQEAASAVKRAIAENGPLSLDDLVAKALEAMK